MSPHKRAHAMRAGSKQRCKPQMLQRCASESLRNIAQAPFRSSEPSLNYSPQSRTMSKPPISTHSEHISKYSITLSTSEVEHSLAELQGMKLRMMNQVQGIGQTSLKKLLLLDRISERGPTLLEQMTDQPNERSMQTLLHGSSVMELTPRLYCCLSHKLMPSSKIFRGTQSSRRPRSSTRHGCLSSLIRSGPISLLGNQLTSTTSLPDYTQSHTKNDKLNGLARSSTHTFLIHSSPTAELVTMSRGEEEGGSSKAIEHGRWVSGSRGRQRLGPERRRVTQAGGKLPGSREHENCP